MLHPTPIRELHIDTPRAPDRGRFIAAGSGLVHAGDHIYVIADDERELGVFPAAGDAPGHLRRMLPGELPSDPAERKRHKPDFEALAHVPHGTHAGGALLALGSGSRASRRNGVLWGLGDDGALIGEALPVDAAPLYLALEREIPDLNIEGAAAGADRLLLFQRGNGRGAVNAVVALDLAAALRDAERGALSAEAVVEIRHYDLGEAGGVRLAFSDAAALPDGRVVYTAVAEAGEDTYNDGDCTGAGVGILSAGGELERWEQFHEPVKVEGVEARADGSGLRLLMVADADDPSTPSPLLEARLHPH